MDCSLKLSRWCSAAPLLQRLEQRRIWRDTPEPALSHAGLRYNPRSSIPHNQVSEAEMEFGFGFGTIAIIIVVLYVLSSIKILREYERGVIFRLGRLLPQAKGPGVILVFAPFDRIVRVSMRVDTFEVPGQDVVTRDNVTVKVNAVIYFRVVNPTLAVIEVSNFLYATSQLAQTTLRSVLGEVELDELLSQREKLNVRLQAILDQHTSPWGVKVTMVEVKQVD